MAHLIAFAHHQPNKIPDLAKKKSRKPADPELAARIAANEQIAAALNFRVALAAQSKRG